MTQPARKPSGWLHGTAETYSKKGEFDENLVSYRRPDFCGRDPLCGRRPHLSTADGTRRAERPALARRRRAQDLADSGFRDRLSRRRQRRATGEGRSEEHTSELQSLMRISYAVFCLNKKTNTN